MSILADTAQQLDSADENCKCDSYWGMYEESLGVHCGTKQSFIFIEGKRRSVVLFLVKLGCFKHVKYYSLYTFSTLVIQLRFSMDIKCR